MAGASTLKFKTSGDEAADRIFEVEALLEKLQ